MLYENVMRKKCVTAETRENLTRWCFVRFNWCSFTHNSGQAQLNARRYAVKTSLQDGDANHLGQNDVVVTSCTVTLKHCNESCASCAAVEFASFAPYTLLTTVPNL